MDADALAAEIAPLLAEPGDGQAVVAAAPRPAAHALLVPAAELTPTTVPEAGRAAMQALLDHADDLLGLLDGDDDLLVRVIDKIAEEPVEDLRVDLADTGPEVATAAGAALAGALERGTTARLTGVRVPSLTGADRGRALHALVGFLSGLGRVPDGFLLGCAGVRTAAQVEALALLCDRLEADLGGSMLLGLEVGAPGSLLTGDGTVALPTMLRAAAGRLAVLGLDPAAEVAGTGPAAVARSVVGLTVDGAGVLLVDAPSPAPGPGESPVSVWRHHLGRVRRARSQGWLLGVDRSPVQLSTRYAAAYSGPTD